MTFSNALAALWPKTTAPKCHKQPTDGIRWSCLLYMSLFIACLLFQRTVHAQPRSAAGAAAGQQAIRPLQIGDTIPEALWQLPLQVVNHPDGSDTIRLHHYRDKKLIILDFWATWCGPCIKSLAKLDSIQQIWPHDLLVMPITAQEKSKIQAFVHNRDFPFPSIVEDSNLRHIFPHRFVPHQVWIRDNKVLAITSGSSANLPSISSAIGGSDTAPLPVKKDLLVDHLRPISDYLHGMDVQVLYRSFFSRKIPGIGHAGQLADDRVKVTYYYNRNILSMYQMALSAPYSEFLLHVQDPDKLVFNRGNSDHTYCYQLIAHRDEPDDKIRQKVLSDLNSNLGLRLSHDTVHRDCYIIRSRANNRTPPQIEDEKGISIATLLRMLNYSKSWHSDILRFVDRSDYTGMLPRAAFTPVNNSTDIAELNRLLVPYGLYIEKDVLPLPYYIISEN